MQYLDPESETVKSFPLLQTQNALPKALLKQAICVMARGQLDYSDLYYTHFTGNMSTRNHPKRKQR